MKRRLYSKDSINGFAKKWINQIHPIRSAIYKANYLEEDIRIEVIEQANILNDLINQLFDYIHIFFP